MSPHLEQSAQWKWAVLFLLDRKKKQCSPTQVSWRFWSVCSLADKCHVHCPAWALHYARLPTPPNLLVLLRSGEASAYLCVLLIKLFACPLIMPTKVLWISFVLCGSYSRLVQWFSFSLFCNGKKKKSSYMVLPMPHTQGLMVQDPALKDTFLICALYQGLATFCLRRPELPTWSPAILHCKTVPSPPESFFLAGVLQSARHTARTSNSPTPSQKGQTV